MILRALGKIYSKGIRGYVSESVLSGKGCSMGMIHVMVAYMCSNSCFSFALMDKIVLILENR